MTESFADLHVHSRYSDGSDTPAQVMERARSLGVGAIALTDHDAVSGLREGRTAAADCGIAFLNGVEISTAVNQHEIHVVGLGIEPSCPELSEVLEYLQEARNRRARSSMEKLHALGIAIDPAKVAARAGSGVISRMHIARELREMGVTRSTQEGFDRFLNHGNPAYAQKTVLEAPRAIEVIHAAGGLAFVAHPGLGRGAQRLLPRLLEMPFDGIEVYHISHTPNLTANYLKLAQTRHLLISGGSDCHGTIKGAPEMGKVRVPWECYENITAALAKKSVTGRAVRPS